MGRSRSPAEEKTLLLQLEVARERAVNQAVSLILDNDGFEEVSAVYDDLALAIGEFESEVRLGLEHKPSLEEAAAGISQKEE